MVSLSADVSQGESCSISVPTAPVPFDRSQGWITNTVARLQEQLQREKDLRTTIEAGLNMPTQNYLASASMDIKIRAELEEIDFAEADVKKLKQKAADLHLQLNQQHQHVHSSFCKPCSHDLHAKHHEMTRHQPFRDC